MKPFLLLLQLKTFQVKLRMKLWSEKLRTVNFYFIFFNITGMVEDNRIDPKMVFSYVQEVYRMCNDLWTVLCSTYVHISSYPIIVLYIILFPIVPILWSIMIQQGRTYPVPRLACHTFGEDVVAEIWLLIIIAHCSVSVVTNNWDLEHEGEW